MINGCQNLSSPSKYKKQKSLYEKRASHIEIIYRVSRTQSRKMTSCKTDSKSRFKVVALSVNPQDWHTISF